MAVGGPNASLTLPLTCRHLFLVVSAPLIAPSCQLRVQHEHHRAITRFRHECLGMRIRVQLSARRAGRARHRRRRHLRNGVALSSAVAPAHASASNSQSPCIFDSIVLVTPMVQHRECRYGRRAPYRCGAGLPCMCELAEPKRLDPAAQDCSRAGASDGRRAGSPPSGPPD